MHKFRDCGFFWLVLTPQGVLHISQVTLMIGGFLGGLKLNFFILGLFG